MPSSWTLAPSLRAALDEANKLWPQRSRASDGTIGDAAHSSRTSDHNPDARGIVHAIDLTHSPQLGPDCNVLAERLRTRVLSGAEKRVSYVIWNKRIFNPLISPNWRFYTGTNDHTKHMHVSIHHSLPAENTLAPWWQPERASERGEPNPMEVPVLSGIITVVPHRNESGLMIGYTYFTADGGVYNFGNGGGYFGRVLVPADKQ